MQKCSESSHLGMPTKPGHYRGERPFDLIVTLYADAQPAPWGVEEIRYGFPDADLDPEDFECLRRIAVYAADRWRQGSRILVRRQAGMNRSGLVMALLMTELGWQREDILTHLRAMRSPAVLQNQHFRAALGMLAY